jgi:Protein of unknown function (DUF1345)
VIGITGQVSAVNITSRKMKRLSLLQGILSFFFNRTILAVTINIVAGIIRSIEKTFGDSPGEVLSSRVLVSKNTITTRSRQFSGISRPEAKDEAMPNC